MSEMVERVAWAEHELEQDDRQRLGGFGPRESFDELSKTVQKIRFARARAAIEAMREPTPDMRIAGGIAWSDALPSAATYVDTADACWKAMIDKSQS